MPDQEALLGAPHGCAFGAWMEVGGRMKTIIEMAREAGIRDCTCDGTRGCLERFAELVRADERVDLYKEIHDPLVLACKKMVADEREACAAQLDFNAQASSNGGDEYIAALLWQEAEELRARGNT